MNNTWKYRGRLNNKEAVFIEEGGKIAIEKDHHYLVDATPEEIQEIYMMWPELLPECKESRRQCPGIAREYDGALKDKIIALEFEAAEGRNVVEALKLSNDERDKMIASLMEDIATEKKKARDLMCWIGRISSTVN